MISRVTWGDFLLWAKSTWAVVTSINSPRHGHLSLSNSGDTYFTRREGLFGDGRVVSISFLSLSPPLSYFLTFHPVPPGSRSPSQTSAPGP
jgi:hypothetical protein